MDDNIIKLAPAKRASCDRCHAYKIRCARSTSDDSVSCARCSYLGVQCVYSLPLPKGRPSGSKRSTGTTASYTALEPIRLLPQPQQPRLDLADGKETIFESWPALEFPGVRSPADISFQPYAWHHLESTADEAASAHHTTEAYSSMTSPAVSETSSATLPHDDTLTISMQQLATLSVSLCKLHNACCSVSAGSKLRPELVSHTSAFSALAILLVDMPILDGYEIFSEACLASRSILQVMDRLRLFGPASDESLTPFDATPGSSPVSGLATASQQAGHPLRNADLQHVVAQANFGGTPRVDPMISTDFIDMHSACRSFEPDRASQNESATLAMRHLLSACYVQLLHVHTILVSLMLHEALQAPGADQGGPFSLARMRLVVISGLVRYLVEHMRRGFATCALTMSSSDQDAMSCAGTQEIDQLEHRLWKDLRELQTCLSAGSQASSAQFCSE